MKYHIVYTTDRENANYEPYVSGDRLEHWKSQSDDIDTLVHIRSFTSKNQAIGFSKAVNELSDDNEVIALIKG